MDTKKPIISIVVPAFNQAEFLADAVDSAMAQTYRDFEIILVDDGSTDETPTVARKFGKAIRYIRQENQGLAGARNTGVLLANGEYVALLDSDDLWLPTFLEAMMALAEDNPRATVYYSGWRYVDAEGHVCPQQPHTWVVPPAEMYWTLLRVNFLIPSTILMRRAQIIQAGAFDASFRRLQDWELWLRLSRDGHVFAGSPECLVHYRLHGNALSGDPAGGQRAALALVNKHFGPDDGQWQTWGEDKRRGYAGVYRYHALMSLQRQANWELCAEYLRKALKIDPTLAEDLDLFYELALGNQPAGYRGLFGQLNLETNAQNVSKLLQVIVGSSHVGPEAHTLRSKVYGNAYLALGIVAYGGRRMAQARQYLIRALRAQPKLLLQRQTIPMLIKSYLGTRLVSYIRHWRTRLTHSAAT